MLRLQKYLSQAGICSRRKAEEYIDQGLVLINGIPATIGQSVDPTKDTITFAGEMVAAQEQLVYYKFNKPYGIVTTCKRDGESSIMDVMKVPERVFPIGRLDKNTTGLIVLTNDGRLSNYLMHPRYEHEKEYVVETYGRIEDNDLDLMSQWVVVLGKKTKEAKISRISSGTFSIILQEWRNRQIRRMVERVGHEVKRLMRVRIENLELGDLKIGQWTPLTVSEKRELFRRLDIH